jgi:streptomycin 6-kinase
MILMSTSKHGANNMMDLHHHNVDTKREGWISVDEFLLYFNLQKPNLLSNTFYTNKLFTMKYKPWMNQYEVCTIKYKTINESNDV